MDLEKKVLELFTKEFGKELGMLDDLNEEGINSIQFTQILVMLEQEMKIKIPDQKLDIYELKTIKAVVDLIRQYLPATE